MDTEFLKNIFDTSNTPNSPDILLFGIALILSVVFSYLLKYFYINFWNSIADKENISSNFVLLTVIITVIITVVKSSLALSLGLVGALSIVRFRTPIKECLKRNNIVNFSNNLKISRIIVYNRDYYESEVQKIRFTIDSNLKYKLWQNNSFKNDVPRIMTQKEFSILEVKYDSNLKSILPIVTNALKIRNQSFSKFVDYRY